MAGKRDKEDEIEVAPDAWERFERAVDVVAKSKPKPRTKKREPAKADPRPASRQKRDDRSKPE